MSIETRLRAAVVALLGEGDGGEGEKSRSDSTVFMPSVWQSELSGAGTSSDRLSYHLPVGVTPLTVDQLAALYLGDPYASRIVGARVDDALRDGFGVSYSGGVPSDEDLCPAIEERLEELDALGSIRRAAKWGLLYGWGAVLLRTDQSTRDAPLIVEQAGAVRGLSVLDRRDVSIATWTEDGGAPRVFRYLPLRAGGTMKHLDRSHLLIFHGRDTAIRDAVTYFDGFSCPVLQPVWEIIRGFQSGWQGATTMLSDASIGVLKLPELARLLAMGGRATLMERLAVMRQSLWSGRWLPIDASEELSYVERSFAGISDLLLEQKTLVAAAAEMPLTRLFGVSPAGLNATGVSDERSWYATVAAERTRRLERPIRQLLALVARELGAVEPHGFAPAWPPLESLSAADQAALELTTAQADLARVQLGMPEEAILRHRYGGASYVGTPPLLDDEELAALTGATALTGEGEEEQGGGAPTPTPTDQ